MLWPAKNAMLAVEVVAQLIDPVLNVAVVFPPEVTKSPSIHPKVFPTLTVVAPLTGTYESVCDPVARFLMDAPIPVIVNVPAAAPEATKLPMTGVM